MDTVFWSARQGAEWKTKVGLAEMLKGGVIMDVTNAAQAKIAEEAGAAAVMALERVPADIRAQGGVARMSDPKMIKEIQDAVSIPVMAKCRIGHFVEARILEALGVDFIDESEVLTPADDRFHVFKNGFKVPFVCGCRDLGEALRRIGEGAAMIRTKGEPGTGDVIEAVKHMRSVVDGIARLSRLPEEELMTAAKELGAPFELVWEVAKTGKLPVPPAAPRPLWAPWCTIRNPRSWPNSRRTWARPWWASDFPNWMNSSEWPCEAGDPDGWICLGPETLGRGSGPSG